METSWKIDYDLKIIYLMGNISDVDLVKMMNDVSTNEKGMLTGPGNTWKIIVIEN